uniref:Zinc finger protein 292b n=1 Tax=Cyprinus carpio carpio TaxID=630221 RepID=A0A9J7ZWP0_CYPCA
SDDLGINAGRVLTMTFDLQSLVCCKKTLKQSTNHKLSCSSALISHYNYAGLWKTDEEPLPVLEVYIIALLSFAQASPYLSAPCEEVPVVLESCLSFLSVSFYALWDRFRSSVQMAHPLVQEKGVSNLMILSSIAREQGVWSNPTLQGILTNDMPPPEKGAARHPQIVYLSLFF